MPSKLVDQRHVSPFHMPSLFFSEELRFPSERQVGFWKVDSVSDNHGPEGMPLIFGSKPDSSSHLEKLPPMGGNTVESLEIPHTYVFNDQKIKVGLKHHMIGTETATGLSRTSWRTPDQDCGSRSSLLDQATPRLVERNKVNLTGVPNENGLFSSSLSEIFCKKLSVSSSDVPFGRSVDTSNFIFGDNVPFESLEEIASQNIGDFLPDDEDLLSGMINGHDYIARPINGHDIEDDLFCSGGGMELEAGDDLRFSSASESVLGETSYGQIGGSNAPLAGEHSYGELRNLFEIHETPDKLHRKVTGFYDVRAAEAARRALNKTGLAGKRVELERSLPGDARSLMQQLSPDLDQEVSSGMTLGMNTNVLDNRALQNRPLSSPFMDTSFHHSSVHHSFTRPMRVATVNNLSSQSGLGDLSHYGYQSTPPYYPHSLPEHHGGMINGIPFTSPSTISAMDIINSRPAGVINNRHIYKAGSGNLNNHSFEHTDGAYGILGNGSCPLHGHQYLSNSSDMYNRPPGAMMWQNLPSFVNNIPSHPPPQMHGFPRAQSHLPNTILSLHNHHVGSAPTGLPAIWDMQVAYRGDTLDASGFLSGSHGNMSFPGSSPMHPLESSVTSAHTGIPSPQQRSYIFHGKNVISSSYDAPNDRARSRKGDASANQPDNRRQYELDIGRIMHGEDCRTTLMIKNIPNKYTSKMLLATIDEHHRGTYDFIYLPIDFKNKCNVGYAFINMVDPQHIIPFYQAFNGKKWEKFNSEKVALLAYARIQGRNSLVAHFQNSSLMNEDKRCRPILFHTDGPNAGDQEPFPLGSNIRSRPGRSRTVEGSFPSTSANEEEYFNAADSSSVSTKESE